MHKWWARIRGRSEWTEVSPAVAARCAICPRRFEVQLGSELEVKGKSLHDVYREMSFGAYRIYVDSGSPVGGVCRTGTILWASGSPHLSGDLHA